MKVIEKGQKIPLAKEGLGSSFIVSFCWEQSDSLSYQIDINAMLLSDSNKLEKKENFIFNQNPNSVSNSVIIQDSPALNHKKGFEINLDKIPNDISRILFILSMANTNKTNDSFKNIKGIKSIISDKANNPVLEFNIEEMTTETAIIAIDIYKRNSEWRIQGVANGFNSGLEAILKEYTDDKINLEEIKNTFLDTNKSSNNHKSEVVNQININKSVNPPEKLPEPKKPVISLSKITLEKKGESTKIDLSKRDDNASNKIHINLNWNQVIKKTSFFSRSKPLDLDLGCMFELKNGNKGVIQALGNAFGSKTSDPYIFLDKDDRTGASNDGENLYIIKPELIKKAAIFCYIYSGNRDFVEAGSYMKIHGLDQEITVNLDNPKPNLTFCVAVLIENLDGIIKIQKINEYVKSHRDCDHMFDFNFHWVSGSKD